MILSWQTATKVSMPFTIEQLLVDLSRLVGGVVERTSLRIQVFSVIYASGWASLEHLLLSRYPSVEPTHPESTPTCELARVWQTASKVSKPFTMAQLLVHPPI